MEISTEIHIWMNTNWEPTNSLNMIQDQESSMMSTETCPK